MKKLRNSKTAFRTGSFGRQNTGVAVGMLALLIVLILLATYGIMDMTERRAHDKAEQLVSEVVDHIDAKMNEVRTVTRDTSETAYANLKDPAALEQLTRDFVAQNAFVYGSTVAFEPDVFPERGRCFAPYSWQTENGDIRSRQLGTETDYYGEEWYAETKRTGEEYLSEPYFDEGGAKIMMCTFSVPLKDESGSLVAVMTADVGLEDLSEYVSSINPYPDSYIVLRSRKGGVLTNDELDAARSGGRVIIKGTTETGWSVELAMPFTYLMYGDSGLVFLIGSILLVTVLFVFLINRLLFKLQQRSSEEYMNVIDAISSGFSSIYVIDLVTNESFVFRDPAGYEEIISEISGDKAGFSAILSRLIEYDCCAQDRERLHREITPAAIREKLTSRDRYEVRFRKELNGTSNWNEMRVFIMERDASGAPLRAVVGFSDVNENVLKENEARDVLEQALDMAQSANKAKTDFLFNMSHDIRTPMNAIIGFTNIALKNLNDRERVADSLTKTQEASELLLSLINDILDMSRIESGKIHLDENEGDVYLSFANIESTMQELAKTKQIDLSFEFGPITDRYVYADFSRCVRIFINIVTNAIKYTNPGGFICVRCEQTNKQDGFAIYRYTFTDNGIGMSEEFTKRVFDKFAREETATVSGIQGTGLGLAVCKSFVTAMNGTIECESRQGEGSTFIVTLPFRVQEGESYTNPLTGKIMSGPESTTVSEGKPVDFAGRRILLVEDNEMNREIAEDILSDEGMLIDTAEDGSVAVEILREKGPDHFDFILMDIQMPIMDGYEATKEIRAMYPKANIPIIALSANAFDEDRIASISAGMNDHVAKPIDITVLKETLARFL